MLTFICLLTSHVRLSSLRWILTYYARAQPFSEQLKALGCGGSSLVSIQAHPVFDPTEESASPERLAFRRASGESTEGPTPTVELVLRHAGYK